MKIAVIDTTIDDELIGGAHTFLPNLLAGLIDRGHEIHFITKGKPNEKVRERIDSLAMTQHRGLWDAAGFVEETAPVLARWLNELAPDIYLISASGDIGWVVLPMLRPEIATLTIGHTDSETFYLPARHYRSFLTRAIGVSPEVSVSYVMSCVIEKEHVEWIPYGVIASENEPSGNNTPLRMIYVGRLEEEQKRVADLARVINQMTAKGVDYRFEIVGDGDAGETFAAAVASEIATGKVVMRGWLAPADVLAAMRRSDVFVLTSAYEGFCIALVESMANGCAPVVTDIRSGNKELVDDGENGFMVPVGDVDAMAERLTRLASDGDMLLAMRRRAWQKARPYGIAKMIETYENCFRQAIADAHAEPRATYSDFPLMETCRSRFPLWLRRLKKMASR